MNSNTAIWDALAKTDPKQTKQFRRAGGFNGTAVKPMWCIKRMTEQFGPCGTGWGMTEPQFQVVPGHNGEVLVYCHLSLWYGEERHAVYGVGGDKVVSYLRADPSKNRPERWENDDEAFKKAFTDALTNAMKHIGVAADIHMGLFDDNKYVSGLRQEFAEDVAAKPTSEPARQQGQKQPNPAYVVKGGDTVGQWVDRLAHLANGAPSDDVRREIAAANGAALQKLHDRHPDEYRRAMTVLGIQTEERKVA